MHINDDLRKRIAGEVAKVGWSAFPSIAHKFKVPEQVVVECLPENEVTQVGVGHFAEIMVMIASWGEVLTSVECGSMTLTSSGMFPLGEQKDGKYKFSGGQPYTISGEIFVDQLAAVYFVQRHLEKGLSKSVVFYNHRGERVFLVSLIPNQENGFSEDQVEWYLSLLERISGKSTGCSCCG